MAKKAAQSGSGKSLVIVESPAKAKTINKYLGAQFLVKACKGHVRDLPKGKYAIDPGRNFEPTYEILPSHSKIVESLRHDAADADTVYLATDLDREGEAIAWHLAHALDLDPTQTKRVIFNEITKTAIQQAFQQPLRIDEDKVNAQQARRILDRIVGYELSPLLWKKVAKGLSAGRVQSVAVRMIVDRENEIRRFQPQEYWTVEGLFTTDLRRAADLAREWSGFVPTADDDDEDAPTAKDIARWLGERSSFRAELVEINGQEFKPSGRLTPSGEGRASFTSAVDELRRAVESLGFAVQETREEDWSDYAHLGLRKITLLGRLDLTAASEYRVRDVDTRRTRVKPSAPFTTATLQQAAANQLRFHASRTMKTAQTLYEGVDLGGGEGPVGLITYMRTDSTHLSADSIVAVRQLIDSSFGAKYLPDQPNMYGSSKSAQQAHEAIRPTDVSRTPASLRGHLTDEQHKLYTLIWNRFVACQMAPAEWDSTTARIVTRLRSGEAVFKAAGRVLVFDGFYRVLGVPRSGEDQLLPALAPQTAVAPFAIEPRQRFTAPPPRYTEATLVKALEAEGIGRPSTYASIIDTIEARGYAEQLDRKFRPTARGEVVTKKLLDHFPKIMDLNFTSHMEDQLDKIEEAHLDWIEVLHEFYDPFKESLGKAYEEMEAVRAEPSPYTCEKCGKPMVYRMGRHGRFLSCTGYPACKTALNVDSEGRPITPVQVDVKCDKCGRPMQLRTSRRGPFLGCTGYPECANTIPCDPAGKPLRKVQPEEIKVQCPECQAPMRVNFARGSAFLGCSKYPECKTTQPLPEGVYVVKPAPQDAGVRCEKCGRPMVIRKSRRGPFISCSGYPRCRNAKPMAKLDEIRAHQEANPDSLPPPPPEPQAAGRKTRARAAGKSAAASEASVGSNGTTITRSKSGKIVVETLNGPVTCPECGHEMKIKPGRFGPFLSCSGFPRCRATGRLKGEALKQAEAQVGGAPPRPKPIPTDVDCPECGAKMVLRMGKTGRFLGCSTYPKCRKAMEAPPGLLREVAADAK